jgi:hypothetical protein
MVVLAINTALKLQDRIYKNIYLLLPPKSDVNLKTGQSVDDNILPWSLYSTLLLYEGIWQAVQNSNRALQMKLQ